MSLGAGGGGLGLPPPPAFPAVNSQQRAGSSKKVALTPGHSLMDWIRLGNSGKDLTSVGGKLLKVTEEELAKHNTPADAWMALRGVVYNITPYLDYHPGGEDELMRGAGIDGTRLFDEVHKWVNAESMLAKCVVGKLETGPSRPSSRHRSFPASLAPPSSNGFLQPAVPVQPSPLRSSPQKPRQEWFQSDETVTVAVYTRWQHLRQHDVILDTQTRGVVHICVFFKDQAFTLHFKPQHDVEQDISVRVQESVGKVEVVLRKADVGQRWTDLGEELGDHNTLQLALDRECRYRPCKVKEIQDVSHDTRLYTLVLPPSSYMLVPTGRHVHIKAQIEGMEVVRSYTPVLPSLTAEGNSAELSLMVKAYPDGALSRVIGDLSVGDSITVSDPEGKFEASTLDGVSSLVLFAAGTGITPMVKLVAWASKHTCQCHLVFFNKTERDILWRQAFEAHAASNKQFSVSHVLSQPSSDWPGLSGRIRREVVGKFLTSDVISGGDKLLVCACGPIPFTEEARSLSKEMGVSEGSFHAFLG